MIIMLKLSHYDEITIGERLWWSHHIMKTSISQSPIDDNVLGINQFVCLLKAELKTKNSTKRLDLLEKSDSPKTFNHEEYYVWMAPYVHNETDPSSP